jgi:hypothetical protein
MIKNKTNARVQRRKYSDARVCTKSKKNHIQGRSKTNSPRGFRRRTKPAKWFCLFSQSLREKKKVQSIPVGEEEEEEEEEEESPINPCGRRRRRR